MPQKLTLPIVIGVNALAVLNIYNDHSWPWVIPNTLAILFLVGYGIKYWRYL